MPSPRLSSTPAGRLIIQNGCLVLPDRLIADGQLVIQNGVIVSAGPRRANTSKAEHVIDAQGGYLSPGFVDLHVHGGGGAVR